MICICSHPQIRQRAYEIFQERLQTGRKGDALSDWCEAEYQIHRRRVPAQASMLHLHPEPAILPLNLDGFRARAEALQRLSIVATRGNLGFLAAESSQVDVLR